jgi:hypothetical protein
MAQQAQVQDLNLEPQQQMDIDLNQPFEVDPLEVFIHPAYPPEGYFQIEEVREEIEKNIPQQFVPLQQNPMLELEPVQHMVQPLVPVVPQVVQFPALPVEDVIGEKFPLISLSYKL